MIWKYFFGAFLIALGLASIGLSIQFFIAQSTEVGRIVAEGAGAVNLKWITLFLGAGMVWMGIAELPGARCRARRRPAPG